MYVRFIAPGREVRRGVDHGLFRPAYDLWRDRATPDGLAWAIRHELEWFERELPVPRRGAFCVKSRRRWLAHGICWFQPDAAAMIAHAHVLAALIAEGGVPVAKVTTQRPGTILYADAWQVVAKPRPETPTRWH